MTNTIEIESMNLNDIVDNLRNLEVESVRVKIEDTNNTHIEFNFRYDKDRKRYYLSSNPIKVEGYMISCRLLSGSFRYLNESPIARKSPKQEKIARDMINVELLESVLEEIKNNKR